jgi:hemolysin activation/secretion protein
MLEQRYHNDGYFLTRVFVPPQLVKDGVLTVQVVEGYVSAVNVDAQDSGLKVRLARMLAPLIGEKPVKLADIETLLLTVNDMPGLIGSSVLRPSDQFGATELILTVRPRRNEYRFSVGNSASDSLGPWTWEAHATLNRAFGRGRRAGDERDCGRQEPTRNPHRHAALFGTHSL